MNDSDVALLVTASALFPGTPADESALLTQLTQLSRDDALCICAKLNAIVSGFAPARSLYERQDEAVSFLQLTLSEKFALSDYAKRHGGPDRIFVFFRGQLLELARAIAVHCQNLPGDGETFNDPAVRSAFLRAALIASELWQARLFGAAGLSVHEPLRQVLGKFRKNVEEASQAPHPGFTTSRGWLLFTQYLPSHLPDFTNRFEQATGLTLRQYFVCAFHLTGHTLADRPGIERLFPTRFSGELPYVGVLNRFIQLQSQTPDDWAQTLRGVPVDSGYRSLRERPIFSFDRNRSVVFEPSLYLGNLSSAPLFQVRSNNMPMDKLFALFGSAFEDYATDLLRRRFPSGNGMLHQALRGNLEGVDRAGNAFQIDALLNIELTTASIFEMKASWLREESILADDPEIFLTEIRKKYSYDPVGKTRKGVAQLARSVGALIRGEWSGPDREYAGVTSVFPVLLVFDERMGTPGLGQFLESEFRTLLGAVPSGRLVHPVTVLTIFDLEHLVWGVESLSLQAFLREYSAADHERLSSVHNFISRSAFLNQVGQSELLEELSAGFMEEARREIMGTSST